MEVSNLGVVSDRGASDMTLDPKMVSVGVGWIWWVEFGGLFSLGFGGLG